MTFIQHQKFLSAYKKYNYSSYYFKIPYAKFSGQRFHGSNFNFKSFQFLISSINVLGPKGSQAAPSLRLESLPTLWNDRLNLTDSKPKRVHALNSLKHGYSKMQKMYFSFKCFLPLNSFKIRNRIMAYKPIHKISSSSYFLSGSTFILNKKWYQKIKNTQLKRSFCFCKQTFSWKSSPLKSLQNDSQKLRKNNLFFLSGYRNNISPWTITKILNSQFNGQIVRLQFTQITDSCFSPLFVDGRFWQQTKKSGINKNCDTYFLTNLRNKLLIDSISKGRNGNSFSGKACYFKGSQATPNIFSPGFACRFIPREAMKWNPIKNNMCKTMGPFATFRNQMNNQFSFFGLNSKKKVLIFKSFKISKIGNILFSGFHIREAFRTSKVFGSITGSILFFSNSEAYHQKWNYKSRMIIQNFIISINETNISILAKRQRFIRNSLKGILLVNFPEKEKNFLIKNLAAENKIPLITQSASLLLKDSRNMDDLLGVDDPIQILFDKVKTCIPCICFINNLDRIGKQRYEQEQKSLHWLNNSISLLIDHRLASHRVFRAVNEKKESVNLDTSVLFNKVSVFDYDLKEMTIFKNFKIFQINTFKNTQGSSQKILKYLTWSGQKPNENQLHQTRPFFNLLIRLSIWSSSACNFKESQATPGLFSTRKDKMCSAMGWDPKNSFYTDANKQTSLQFPILKKIPSIISSSSMFSTKMVASRRFNWLIRGYSKIWTRPLLKQILTKDAESLFFRLDKKQASRLSFWISHPKWEIPKRESARVNNQKFNNSYYHRLPFWLFKMNSLDQHKKIAISSRAKLLDSFYNSYQKENVPTCLPSVVNSLPLQMTFSQTLPLLSKTKPIFEKPKSKMIGLNSIASHFLFSLEKRKTGAACDPLKREAEPDQKTNFKNPHISYNRISFKNSIIGSASLRNNNFAPKPTTYKLLPNTEKEPNKNNSLKITETDIIKRTALLKFLQILDGFHTTTGSKKSVSFPYFNLELFKKFNMPEIFLTLPKTIKPKPSKLKINNKYSFSAKDFKAPLFLQKESEKYGNAIILNSIQNHIWFPYGILLGWTRTQKRNLFKFNFKNSLGKNYMGFSSLLFPNQNVSKMSTTSYLSILNKNPSVSFTRPKNDFLGHPLQKKTFESLLLASKVPKWEIYLKKQPSLKSLNLLCVWPSYIEDILGPLNINDGASYILPEYFQLLGHGPKLKKQGITLIASTNNLTTLDAALLRPGRFDTIINFSHSFSFMQKSLQMLKHSPSLIQDKYFSLSKSSIREKKTVNFSVWPWKFNQESMAKNKQENSLFLLKNSFFFRLDLLFHVNSSLSRPRLSFQRVASVSMRSDGVEPKKRQNMRSDQVRPNNTILLSSISSMNIYKAIKNQFYLQVTVLDIPSQSTPIKTFIDVSVFIQYKLWWSFSHGKLSWLRLHQKALIQEQKTQVSNSENFKIFKPSTYGAVVILKSFIHKLKDLGSTPLLHLEPLATVLNGRRSLTYLFIGILRMIYFGFFYNLFQFSMMFKTKLTNQTKLTTETYINQNYDFANTLSREVFISKAVVDSRFSSLFVVPRQKQETMKSEINQNWNAYFLTNVRNQRSVLGLPKNLYSLDFFLDQYYVPKTETDSCFILPLDKSKGKINKNNKERPLISKPSESGKYLNGLFSAFPVFDIKTGDASVFLKNKNTDAWKLSDSRNKTTKNFISNLRMKQHDDIFLKSNRSLLFCTGDFDYKAYLEKDSDIILIKKPWEKKHLFWPFSLNDKKQTKNIVQPQPTASIKNKKALNYQLKTEQRKNTFLSKMKSEFNYSTSSIKVLGFFLDQSCNFWKPFQAKFLKNVDINNIMLTKYNEIYKLKKIKFKQQSFVNLHPFTSFMLKRWLELVDPRSKASFVWDSKQKTQLYLNSQTRMFESSSTKSNKLKRHLKVSLVNKILPFSSTPIYKDLYSATVLVPTHISLLEKELSKTLATDSSLFTYESYLFKKIGTNSSLNIACLQIDPTLTNLEKEISDKFFDYRLSPCKNWISSIHLSQKENRLFGHQISLMALKKIPRQTFISHRCFDFPTTCKIKCCNVKTDKLEMNDNIILVSVFQDLFLNTNASFVYNNKQKRLKNLVSNQKKGHNSVKTRESFVQAPSVVPEGRKRLQAKQWGRTQNYKMCRLDVSFFILIFYTMFFEKIQASPDVSRQAKQWGRLRPFRTQPKKITLNTIKILMPYKSLIFSHFLLSQGETYGFSCKNFEILIYNKFKNFLVDL